jgi:hypothetical protein
MIFAYADPPYPGNAKRYPEKTEVNHRELVDRLVYEFLDGWALSTSSVALKDVLSLCPPTVRVAAWVKPFAVFKPNVNPAYAWEPVIFRTVVRRPRTELTIRDWVSANITLKKGLVGAKPPMFCEWILDLLGFRAGDTIVDLYPGTGIMGETAKKRTVA